MKKQVRIISLVGSAILGINIFGILGTPDLVLAGCNGEMVVEYEIKNRTTTKDLKAHALKTVFRIFGVNYNLPKVEPGEKKTGKKTVHGGVNDGRTFWRFGFKNNNDDIMWADKFDTEIKMKKGDCSTKAYVYIEPVIYQSMFVRIITKYSARDIALSHGSY